MNDGLLTGALNQCITSIYWQLQHLYRNSYSMHYINVLAITTSLQELFFTMHCIGCFFLIFLFFLTTKTVKPITCDKFFGSTKLIDRIIQGLVDLLEVTTILRQ